MPFQQILLPLDGSQAAEEAIPHALSIAQTSGAQIHLLHVQKSRFHYDDNSVDSVDWRLRRAELRRYLNRLSERISAMGQPVALNIREGRPAEQIVEYAEEGGIDLIVFTAFGHGGASRFRFGSTAQKVIAGSGVSFLVVHPGDTPPAEERAVYRRVLVSMDGSHRSEWVACEVAAMMGGQKAELVLLQVIAVPEMPRRMPVTREEQATREKFVECNRRAAEIYLDDIARQLRNGIHVRARLAVALRVAENVCAVAAEEAVDLIAVSARDSQSCAQLATGAVCQAVMRHCPRPVLVFQDLPDTEPQRLRAGGDALHRSQQLYAGSTPGR